MTPQPAKPRVMIVDDHPANRRAFETLLENEYTVALAASGYQALELTLRDDYAVILLDVKMPAMDGFEVAELLRKRERTRHTPIVFISAYDQTVFQMKKGYVVGATDFIFSPVDEELLKFKVATYAKIYLHHEALRLQIRELQATIGAIRDEAPTGGGSAAFLGKIRNLETQAAALKREIDSTAL